VRPGELRVDIGVATSLVRGGIQAGHRAGRDGQMDIAGDDEYLVAIHGDRAAGVWDRLGRGARILRDLALEPD
jgi:hypothetical protein